MPNTHQLINEIGNMALFVAVVRAKSYAAAAKRLGMPASTLSRRLASFERSIGLTLIQRTTRSVQLAPQAQDYFEACLQAIAAVEHAQSVLTTTGHGHDNHIRMSMPVDLGNKVLAPICADFAHRHPRISFSVTLSASPVDLLTEPFDLAFRIGHPMDDRVVARPIGTIPSGLYVSPTCTTERAPLEHPQQLESWPCIQLLTGRGEMAWHVDEVSWPKTPGPTRLGAGSVSFVHELALAGHGVALLPQHMAHDSCLGGHLVRLLPQAKTPAWPIYALTTSRSPPASIRSLIDFVKKTFAQHPKSEV